MNGIIRISEYLGILFITLSACNIKILYLTNNSIQNIFLQCNKNTEEQEVIIEVYFSNINPEVHQLYRNASEHPSGFCIKECLYN